MSRLFLVLLLLLACSCERVSDDLQPKLQSSVQDRYLRQLPAPFHPLTSEEKVQDWGKEYLIALHFAKELDLYRAVTAFKRAQILLPPRLKERSPEIDYAILLCYYLGGRYEDVITTFQTSELRQTNSSFAAFHDLLVILYDAYQRLGKTEEACEILQLLQTHYPATYERLYLSSAMLHADFETMHTLCPNYAYLPPFFAEYETCRKSIGKAQFLNALLPGAGYFYLGQKQTGVTALLVNGFFIAAATHFFMKGEVAAGAILTSFEAGWYFGGIYGAGIEARFYNERLYERLATPLMNREGLFPVFMINYAF